MARNLFAAMAMLFSVAHGTAYADEGSVPPEETVTMADEAVVESAPEPEPIGYSARVRLTYYNLTGRTASGIGLYLGSTACSMNWSFGQRFRFSDGEVVTCIDRGLLGVTGWLDVWSQPRLANKYGQYTTVRVLP